MVLGPDKLVHVLPQLEESQAQERRLGKLEPAPAVGLQPGRQPLALLRRAEAAPRGALHGQPGLPEGHLSRRLQVLPEERRTQDGVPRDEGPPSPFECRKVEAASQPQAHLEHVHP